MQHAWMAERMAGETENKGAHAKPVTMCSSSGCPLKYLVGVVLTLPWPLSGRCQDLAWWDLQSRPTQFPGQKSGMYSKAWGDAHNLTSHSRLFGYRGDRMLR